MKLFGLNITKDKPKLLAKAGTTRRGLGGGSRIMSLIIGRGGSVSSTDVDVKFFTQEGYQKCPPVYSIVNNIAEGVGKAVWCIKDKDGKKVDVALLNKSVGKAPALLEVANDLQSWTDFHVEATVHELLEGNLFVTGDFAANNTPNTLSALPTDGMHIFGDPKKKKITHYKQQYSWGQGDEYAADQMMHVKGTNPDWTDGNAILFGQSPFEVVRSSILAYNESLDSGVFFLRNKGAQKLIYNKNEDYDLGIEGEETINDSINLRGQGVENTANIVQVIDNADLGVIDISSDPKKALVLEQRHQAALEICNAVNYPPEKLGLMTNTYQNAKYAEKGFWEHCVIPILERRKAGLQKFMMYAWSQEAGQELFIDYSLDHIDALQEDKLLRGKSIKEYAGMITIPMALEMANLPIPDFMKVEPTNMDEWKELLYLGFTQAVVTDQEEISPINDDEDKEEPTKTKPEDGKEK